MRIKCLAQGHLIWCSRSNLIPLDLEYDSASAVSCMQTCLSHARGMRLAAIQAEILRFRFLTMVRRSSWTPMASRIYLRASSLEMWFKYKMFSSISFPRPGPEDIKLFSCSTQLSMKFALPINLKLLTIANSFLLNIAEHETFSAIVGIFIFISKENFMISCVGAWLLFSSSAVCPFSYTGTQEEDATRNF